MAGEQAGASEQRQPAPVILPATPLRDDWPPDGIDPFTLGTPETMWVLFSLSSSNHHWGRAWPAGDFRDYASWTTDFEHRVPMGYRGIAVVERIAIALDGLLLGRWEPTETGSEPGALERWPGYISFPQTWEPPTVGRWSPQVPAGAELPAPARESGSDQAIRETMRISSAARGVPYMTLRFLRHDTWH